jgi:hypothetical protein
MTYEIARAARPEDFHQTGHYPVMPVGWCRHAALILHLVYGLDIAEGTLHRLGRYADNKAFHSETWPHSWNMTRDRLIIDPTMGDLERRLLVDRRARLTDDATLTLSYSGRTLTAEEASSAWPDTLALGRKIREAIADGAAPHRIANWMMQQVRMDDEGSGDRSAVWSQLPVEVSQP